LPPLTAWAGALIIILTLAGYGALLGFLHLFLFPLRLRRMMPGGAVSLTRHRVIADVALGLTLVHSIGYLAAEPAVWRYLLPSAPLYMLAGLVGLLLLAVLALTSRHKPRQRLTRSTIGFRGQHVVLSALLLIAVLIHVVGAGLLVDSRWKALLCALTAALAIAGLARPAPKER